MDVEARVKSWRKQRRIDGRAFTERVRLVEASADVLDRLPDGLSFSTASNGVINLSAYLSDDKAVKEMTRQIRSILGVKKSEKQFSSGDATITYVTSNDVIRTSVHGGAIPKNCTLVPESHSYISYTMQCEEE